MWMLQGRVDAHGEALDQANEVVDSADPGGEVGEVTPEVKPV